MSATYYKWLLADNSAPLGKGKWTPGEWLSVKGELIPCNNGLHLCRPQDLVHHMSERLWIAEADESELIEHEGDKIVVRRARIIRIVETINDRTLRLFACDCAERVVGMAGDDRSSNAIAVARRYAHGAASNEELSAARNAATDAARAAAWAAWEAAGDAARNAARAAQNNRLLQYVEHGDAAEHMPWSAP